VGSNNTYREFHWAIALTFCVLTSRWAHVEGILHSGRFHLRVRLGPEGAPRYRAALLAGGDRCRRGRERARWETPPALTMGFGGKIRSTILQKSSFFEKRRLAYVVR